MRKQITSISDWFTAFSAYAAVLTSTNQTWGPDLFEYMNIIAIVQQEHSGNAWSTNIDPTSWNRAFSGQSRLLTLCNICMKASHGTTSCDSPLYTPGPASTHMTIPTGPAQSDVAIHPSVSTPTAAHVNATPALEDTNSLPFDARGTTPILSAPSCAPPPAIHQIPYWTQCHVRQFHKTSRSEPHTSDVYSRFIYIYIYISNR